MKNVHWIAYPVLFVVILAMAYNAINQAVWLDDMKEGSRSYQSINKDLLRFAELDLPCDKSPRQLATDMWNAGGDYFVTTDEVSHDGFRAIYKSGRLSRIEDAMGGSAAVCGNDRGAK